MIIELYKKTSIYDIRSFTNRRKTWNLLSNIILFGTLISACHNPNKVLNVKEGEKLFHENEQNNSAISTSNIEDISEDKKEEIKYKIKKHGRLLDVKISTDNIDPRIIKHQKKRNGYTDKIRMHWDSEYRKNRSDKIEVFNENEDEGKQIIKLKKGELTLKDWLKIKDINIINNVIDPLHLNSNEAFPERYITELKYNKLKKNNLLKIYRVAGVILILIYFGVEIIFIPFKKSHYTVFAYGVVFWGVGGLFTICPLSYWLIDPYYRNTSKCIKIEEEIIIKEPSECHKKTCCMQQLDKKAPGYYRCFGCFIHPICMTSFCDKISSCLKSITSRIFSKCRKQKTPAKQINISINKPQISETISLIVGEN